MTDVDPNTVQIVSTAGTFVLALLIHGIRRADRFLLVSALLTLVVEVVLNLTFYSEGWSGSDKWFGPFILFDVMYKFGASVAAAGLILTIPQRPQQ